MTSVRATIFNLTLALAPPAAVLGAEYLGANVLTTSSLVTKTLGVLLYVYVLYNVVIRYFTSPLRHLPSPGGDHLILGHGLVVIDKPRGSTMLKWMKTIPNDGLIHFRSFFHLRSSILVTTPQTVMEILNAHSYDWEKPGPARRFLRRVLGDGLINVEGNEHKQQRRNVTPAFSGKAMKDLVPLFWAKGLALTAAVAREAARTRDNVVELGDLASRTTLDVIGTAGLGKDFNAIGDSEHELAHQYALITDPKKGSLVLYFFLNMVFPQWFVRRLPLEANARVANATFALRRITKELLAEKHQAMDEKTVEQKDIIAILMRSGKFNDDELTDQLLTFLAAGHETTSSALEWVAYLLCKHPEVKARLRSEIQQACGNVSAEDFGHETLEAMPYLEAVCNEVLRIFPTVPVTTRQAVRNTPIGDVMIPAGTVALISPWAMNRSPLLWGPDAEEFRPERWLGEKGKNGGASSPYAFITFLHGPRSCIGQVFARNELKCLVAALLLKYDFRLKDPEYIAVPEGAVTIKPRDGLDLIMTEMR